MPGPVGRVARRLRAEGLAGVFRALGDRLEDWGDARFDRRFGIDTAYEPGHQPIQRHAFRRIAESLQPAAHGWGFMDFGCGKGRALILAAEHGFTRIAGVEASPALHAKALENVARYRGRRPSSPPFEVLLGDAADAEPPECGSVLFFYNPFDAATLARVLSRLRAAWQEGRPEWFLAYRTPVHAGIVNAEDWLEPVVERADFRTWRTRSTGAR